MTARLPGDRRTTVLIAEDHADMRTAIAELVDAEPDLVVIGTAVDTTDAVWKADAMAPDVVVLDVHMPNGGGWEAGEQIHQRSASTRIVAYSAYTGALVVRRMVAAGISAYVVKGGDCALLLAAIRGQDTIVEGTTAPLFAAPIELAVVGLPHQRFLRDPGGRLKDVARNVPQPSVAR